jgi:hypothetical protein
MNIVSIIAIPLLHPWVEKIVIKDLVRIEACVIPPL